jgi:hypothetical protein
VRERIWFSSRTLITLSSGVGLDVRNTNIILERKGGGIDRARGMLSPAQFGIFCTMDPGSTTGGMLQAQMAGLIDRVKQAEVKKESAWPAKSPSDR